MGDLRGAVDGAVEGGVVAVDEDHHAAAARGDVGAERRGELQAARHRPPLRSPWKKFSGSLPLPGLLRSILPVSCTFRHGDVDAREVELRRARVVEHLGVGGRLAGGGDEDRVVAGDRRWRHLHGARADEIGGVVVRSCSRRRAAPRRGSEASGSALSAVSGHSACFLAQTSPDPPIKALTWREGDKAAQRRATAMALCAQKAKTAAGTSKRGWPRSPGCAIARSVAGVGLTVNTGGAMTTFAERVSKAAAALRCAVPRRRRCSGTTICRRNTAPTCSLKRET